MPRCGAFGVRQEPKPSPASIETSFNAPVWGLRCATCGASLVAEHLKLFQCPGVGPSVCDVERDTFVTASIGVSMPRCGAFGVRLGFAKAVVCAIVWFQCPGVGPSVCDSSGLIWGRGSRSVSMPRCGAFGVRPIQATRFLRRLALFQCPGVGPSVCDGMDALGTG